MYIQVVYQFEMLKTQVYVVHIVYELQLCYRQFYSEISFMGVGKYIWVVQFGLFELYNKYTYK